MQNLKISKECMCKSFKGQKGYKMRAVFECLMLHYTIKIKDDKYFMIFKQVFEMTLLL